MANQLNLSLEELNQLKLSTLIEMADELEALNKEDNKKVMGDPNNFRL